MGQRKGISESTVRNIKRQVFSALTLSPVNLIGKKILKSFPGLSARLSFNFPAMGRLKISAPDGRSFTMVSDGSDSIASIVYFSGMNGFEPETTAFLTSKLKGFKVFVDIGANSGFYSLLASTINPLGRVFGFEPNPDAFTSFQRNVEANSFQNTRCESLALGDNNGVVEFFIPEGITLATGASTNASHREGTKKVACEMQTLDRYFEDNEIQGLDIIKLDTESTEPQVLAGAIQTIRRFSPMIVCEILVDKAGNEILDLLQPLGYQCFHITDSGLVEVKKFSLRPQNSFLNFAFIVSAN